jgi:hypothetical protein
MSALPACSVFTVTSRAFLTRDRDSLFRLSPGTSHQVTNTVRLQVSPYPTLPTQMVYL